MNARLDVLEAPAESAAPVAHDRARGRDYVTLSKPRITLMVVLTALVGFFLASGGAMDGWTLTQTLLGTALASMGASALNMVLEREADGRMRRTRNRPLPAGRLTSAEAAVFGIAASVAGVAWLAAAHPLAAIMGALTVFLYICAYTPLKAKTSLATVVGAVPGALPPVIGWTAASGAIEPGALALFLILFFWQLPHFLAIAWMYRDDYARAGYPMLPVVEPEGTSTGRQVVVQGAAMVLVSLLPIVTRMAGPAYFWGALALGAAFLALCLGFAVDRTHARAQKVFFASLVYLPVLLSMLAFCRL